MGLSGARAVERNRSLERDVEGEGAGLVAVLDVGCEERGGHRRTQPWVPGGAVGC